MKRTNLLILIGLGLAAVYLVRPERPHPDGAVQAQGPEKPRTDADLKAELDQLREQLKHMEGLVPDQAAVMSHLAYHFSNLWFAVEDENWPLADFYLSETRSNLKWAVRAKPLRKSPDGKETVDVKAIAEAVDNGPLTQLKKAIGDKDKKAFAKQYTDALGACYACHKASFKPYLRPQVPKAPEVRVINFDPKATEPQ
jgi:cytochrome c553